MGKKKKKQTKPKDLTSPWLRQDWVKEITYMIFSLYDS